MKKSARHLVIGLGEVGNAVKTVLEKKYTVKGIDKGAPTQSGRFDVLHICFPYSKKFTSCVKAYQHAYGTKNCLVIIHSTVPIGVSRRCSAVHSPIRGIHPHLALGIRTFIKYFGGPRAADAANIFSNLGIPTRITDAAENTEALKLWDTTIYGWNIILEKEIYRYCQKHKLDFNLIYTEANTSYNDGYEKLRRPEFKKFILRHIDGPIGGHCVSGNCELLRGTIAEFILKQNKKL